MYVVLEKCIEVSSLWRYVKDELSRFDQTTTILRQKLNNGLKMPDTVLVVILVGVIISFHTLNDEISMWCLHCALLAYECMLKYCKHT